MTVSTEVDHNEYTGNGATTSFPYTFRIFKKTDLVVQVSDLNGNVTELVLDTGYTVTGAGTYSGGSVVLPSPLAAGWRITIDRVLDVVQETDLRNQGKFFPEVHEDAFDYLTMLIQQCFGWFRRALMKPSLLAKYYDAKQNRISNLADPSLEQDAVNNRSMRNYVDAAIAGVVGGFGWFIQYGSGAMYRTFQDKMRDMINVKDFGVKMNGTDDDTDALNSAFTSGRTVYIPAPVEGPALISGTILISDNTVIIGPGKEHVAIKCAQTMDPASHALATYNYANGIATANKNIHIEGLCIDGNGYARAPGTDKPGGCGFVINAEDTTIKNCRGINAPLWNLFVTSGNPFEDIGHNGTIKAPSKRVVVDGFTSVDPVHGDGAIIQGTWDSVISNFTSLYTSALASSTLRVRADTGIQLIEGCRSVTVKGVVADHAKTVTTAVGIGCHVNRPYMSDIVVDGVQAKGLSTCVALWNDSAVVPVGGSAWKNRRFSIRNVHLQNPILDPASTVMQARLVDVQNAMGVSVNNVSVSFLDDSGAYSAPTAVVSFAGCHDFELDGVEFKDVPDVGSTSYAINRSRGWVAIAGSTCKRGRVRNVRLDNIGYYNRVISDTSSLALDEIKNLTVDAIPSDGQPKTGLVCGNSYCDISGITVPAGMARGTVGPTYATMSRNNSKVAISDMQQIVGGLNIVSSNPSGVQTQPGILFDRQFTSASSSNGKGALAFRSSVAAPGTLSFTSFDEDSGLYVPLMTLSYSSAATVKKYMAPIVDGDMNSGNATARWQNVYSVNGVITTSDADDKDEIRDATDKENEAFAEIARLPSVWKWIRRIEEEGDEARLHSGPTVQAAIDIMKKHGLEWGKYSCFCFDYIPATEERIEHFPAVVDEDGTELVAAYEVVIPASEEVSRYSFRKEELLWWCLRAIATQYDSLSDRVSKLESN
ncbi:glycosyl hydrolase family 28-related protein [Escherichia coli]|nr:hypothetical protein [Escherichia coli]HAN7103330.1 hypothetical protein [Escherichia coli]HBK1366324.1 hypothetical protein [Escherichia coli]